MEDRSGLKLVQSVREIIETDTNWSDRSVKTAAAAARIVKLYLKEIMS